jgi:hypothetical protein
MSFRYIGLAAFLFVGMTAINRVLEGALIGSSEVTILNQLTVFRELNVVGFFSVPVLNLDFLTQGLPHLFKWDYSFFGGNASIIQYFLYSMTAAASFGLFLLMLGLLYNMFGRATGR